MNVALLQHLPPPHQAAPKVRIISGQAIAKSKWEPRERALLAAKWRLGWVEVAPTTKLAADVFTVSVPLVVGAIGDLKAFKSNSTAEPTTAADIDSIWDNLSGAERDEFVQRRLIAVWDAIDRVTA